MSRLFLLKNLYDEITQKITDSPHEWKSFLKFAGIKYKYSFDNIALIYAQRPDSTVVADMQTWNKRIGRYINKGAKSIGVFDTHDPTLKLRYLFDYSDTNGNTDTKINLWHFNEQHHNIVTSELNQQNDSNFQNIEEFVDFMASEVTEAMSGLYDGNFESFVRGTKLETLPTSGLENCFQQFVYDSVRYMVGQRCGIEVDEGNSFSLIKFFDTKPLICLLGSTVCSVSKDIINEFRRNLSENIKRSVANNERTDGIDLYRERWDTLSQYTDFQRPDNGRKTSWEIRTNGIYLPQGESSDTIQSIVDGRRIDGRDAQSGYGSERDDGRFDGEVFEERPDTRSEQNRGSLPTQIETGEYSRRDSDKRDSNEEEINQIVIPSKESHNSGSFLLPIESLGQNRLSDLEGTKEKVGFDNDSIEIKLDSRINYQFSPDDEIGVGGPKTKFRANIEAIKTLKVIEFENRLATWMEQRILARYTGWGGLAQAFDPNAAGWEKEYKELKEALTSIEYESERASTPNAHYTQAIVIDAIYKAIDKFGFKDGNLLEPALGVGNFFSMLPDKMQDAKLYGVELDIVSGRIAQQLYQKANIQINGYEETDFPDNFFDVAISNVPFGERI